VKLIFLGSPDYSVPSLRALHRSDHEIVGVVTQPARAAGRGKKVTPTAVAAAAAELGIGPVIETADVNDPAVLGELGEMGADILVTVAFGQMLKRPALDLCARGAVNAHGSLLPRHRGASPVQAAILAGEGRTGVTIMRMVREMDAGPVILQEAVRLAGCETAAELHDTLAELSARMLVEALDAIEAGTATEAPQDDSEATCCRTITKADGRLDFTEDAEIIERKVRAYHPWPGAFTELPLKGGRTERVTVSAVEVGSKLGEGGIVLQAGGGRGGEGAELVIGCCCPAGGSVRVLRLKPAGKREMTAEEYLRGRDVVEGGSVGVD